LKEIRFRAWFNSMEKMIYKDDNVHISTFLGKYVTTNSKLMQFTGLKDSKGIDIYENDIVRWKQGDIVVQAMVSWYLFGWSPFTGLSVIPIPYYKECEVIGNIYENKELLGK